MTDTATQVSFGKYQILDRIAVGGMAEIFKARIDGIGGFHRNFALKRILPHLAQRPEYVEMLVEEAKIAGLLTHTNIVQIFDLGEIEGAYFIAMEYVHGPDLGRVLQRCKAKNLTLPIPHAVFIMTELLKGLEYAHARQVMRGGRAIPLNIVHRDICPANLLVSYKGEVKLTDFGIAKASVRNLSTITDVVKGRLNYLSPEQVRGDEVDQRSDLFCSGVLLYEMLTGKHPFARPKQAATLDAIKQCAFAPASELNPEIPYTLDILLSQTLHPDPEERYRSATAMKDALDRYSNESGRIFSHSTLAAFLRGLFPEETGLDNEVHVPDVPEDEAETRPITREDRFDEPPDTEEAATGIVHRSGLLGTIDTTIRKPISMLENLADLSQSSIFGPVGEEATIVDRPSLDNKEWAELETLIRRAPEKEQPNTSATDEPEPTHLGAPPSPFSPSPVQRPSKPPKKRPRRKAPQSQAAIRRTQILSLGFGVVIVISALLVGFLLGHRTAKFTAPNPINITVNAEPQLEVNMPVGATLSVDGRQVPGEPPVTVNLSAGKDHVVRIELDDHFPIETSIRLNTNDVRILSIDRGTLHPKKTKAKGRR